MDLKVLNNAYKVYTKEILKSKAKYLSQQEIENYLIAAIKKHPVATYITTFDHYAHTKSLGGIIPPDIKAATNVLCCFGMAIPSAIFVGVKPMSIAVVEKEDRFICSFEEAPAPSAQKAMEEWIENLDD